MNKNKVLLLKNCSTGLVSQVMTLIFQFLTRSLFIRHGLLGSIPARELYDYLILLNSYLTIALTASSPSTATATIPAGTEIVALSEVRTVSAITLPKIFVITTDLPAAP